MAKILVVDDVAENITMIKDSLKTKYEVIAATSGYKALDIVKKDSLPDLILLDILMPDINGFEVCEQLKADERTRDIPVIFLTVLDEKEDIVEGFKHGGVDYIVKPFEPSILHARVNTHLTLAKQHKELQKYNSSLERIAANEIEKKEKISRKLFAMFEQANEGFAFLDHEFIITDLNEHFAQILSLEYSNIIDKKIDNIANGMFSNIISSIDDDGNSSTQNIEFYANDNKIIVQTKCHKVYSPDGSDSCIILSIDDITQKKELEDKLIMQSKQAEMGDMIAMIAHQWKQPLSIISTLSTGLKFDIELNKDIESQKVYNFMTDIEKQVLHMSDTIDDFKNYLKPEEKPAKILISQLIYKVLNIIGKSLVNKSIDVNTVFGYDFMVEIYINEIVHVLLNILTNSQNAILKNNIGQGKVNIYTTQDDKYYYLHICDNGGGIDETIMDQIGNKYFTTDSVKGTGLGLYMSKKIIKKYLDTDIVFENRNSGLALTVKFKKESSYVIDQ